MAKSMHVGAIDWKRFGERIGREIKATGLSYRDLSEEIGGIHFIVLYRVVAGRTPVCAKTYLWLCQEFNIDPMWAYRKK